MKEGLKKKEKIVGENEIKEKYIDMEKKGVRKYWERERKIEIKKVQIKNYLQREKMEKVKNVWVRERGIVNDERELKEEIIDYI